MVPNKGKQRRRLDYLIVSSFKAMGDKLGCTALVEHAIKTNYSPIRQIHNRFSKPIQDAVNVELDEMLKYGVIGPSDSPWHPPILVLKKPDGLHRLVSYIRYRDAY